MLVKSNILFKTIWNSVLYLTYKLRVMSHMFLWALQLTKPLPSIEQEPDLWAILIKWVLHLRHRIFFFQRIGPYVDYFIESQCQFIYPSPPHAIFFEALIGPQVTWSDPGLSLVIGHWFSLGFPRVFPGFSQGFPFFFFFLDATQFCTKFMHAFRYTGVKNRKHTFKFRINWFDTVVSDVWNICLICP